MHTTSGFIRSMENAEIKISAISNIYSIYRISFQHKKVRKWAYCLIPHPRSGEE